MNTRLFLSLSFLSATLFWGCQKEKQPVVKLPDIRIQDSVQQGHSYLSDTVVGVYIVSGFRIQSPYSDKENIKNDTVLISKRNDSIVLTRTSNELVNYIIGRPCQRIIDESGFYNYGFSERYENMKVDFPLNNLDSIYIYFYATNCDFEVDIELNGTKIQ